MSNTNQKKCNAIKHSVYMGDGIRLFYEKPDIITFMGEPQRSVTVTYIKAAGILILQSVRQKVAIVSELFKGQDTDWPPHHILCGEMNPDCYKCKIRPRKYNKAIRE